MLCNLSLVNAHTVTRFMKYTYIHLQAQDLCALLHMVDSMIRMPHANFDKSLEQHAHVWHIYVQS